MAGAKIAGLELKKLFPAIRITESDIVIKNTVGFPADKPDLRAKALKTYKQFRVSPPPPAS